MITLLLVDADHSRRDWLCTSLERAGFLLVGQADTTGIALATLNRCKPQIVLIAPDILQSTPAEATRLIMEHHPVPIVLMAKGFDYTANKDYKANWFGATALIEAPPPPEFPDHSEKMSELIDTLKLMHEIPVVKRTIIANRSQEYTNGLSSWSPLSTSYSSQASPSKRRFLSHGTSTMPGIIGIASSTGGPAVLQTILYKLPSSFPIPIVIVQHLSEGFSSALVGWLNDQVNLRVIEAQNGMIARPGSVYMATGQQHLEITYGPSLSLLRRSTYPGHCPSATAMFNSLALSYGPRAIGIVLTGMGDDGAEGLLAIKRRGGTTYAQDEASCVIPSMPKEAVARGAISAVMTPTEIAALLLKLTLPATSSSEHSELPTGHHRRDSS